MDITERANVLLQWLKESTYYVRNESEVVAHIALAFIEERQIAFADHGEACAKMLDEKASEMYGLATDSQQKEHFETASAAKMTAKKLTKLAEEIRKFTKEVSK